MPHSPKTESTQRDSMVPLVEFGKILLDMEEIILEIRALGGIMRPLISDRKKATGAGELLQRFRGSLRTLEN